MPFKLSISMSFMNRIDFNRERPKRKQKYRPASSRKGVAWDVADRRDADRVQRIDSPRRAHRQRIAPQVGRQVRRGEEGACRLLILQSPLLLRAINNPKIIDARRR